MGFSNFLLSDSSFDTHKFLDGPYSRVPKELGCAFAASLLVSPLVSIIDKAIVQQEIRGVHALVQSMGGACKQMVKQPRAFAGGLPFRMTFAVYFGTYAVANLSEAALDYQQEQDEQTRKLFKVSGASAVNIGLLAWRDSILAREFATPVAARTTTPSRSMPLRTVGLFAVRDSVTMAATFYVAPKVSRHLVEERGWKKNRADVTAALTIPVLSQFLTAPLHIHALDYYAHSHHNLTQRVQRIQQEMGKVCFARGLRILPAFGIGSFANNKFREMTIKQLGGDLTIGERIQRRVTDIAIQRRVTTLEMSLLGCEKSMVVATSSSSSRSKN